jgi:hypothetical protein
MGADQIDASRTGTDRFDADLIDADLIDADLIDTESVYAWPTPDPARFRMARVFDHVDPVKGPFFADDHPVVADAASAARLVALLNGGAMVLGSATLMDDVLDPRRRATVPMNYRTDGTWIWTDAVTYYLQWYGIAPEPDLLQHLLGDGSAGPTVRPQDVDDAIVFILAPPSEGGGRSDVVWAPG